jgi:hypothetical protein
MIPFRFPDFAPIPREKNVRVGQCVDFPMIAEKHEYADGSDNVKKKK